MLGQSSVSVPRSAQRAIGWRPSSLSSAPETRATTSVTEIRRVAELTAS
jgi:hypothetical protein